VQEQDEVPAPHQSTAPDSVAQTGSQTGRDTVAPHTGLLWGVGAVSRRLGIATPTLRTWDRRYGMGPSARTEGGHRRYSEADVARVSRMSQLIAEGVPPAQAAQVSAAALSGFDSWPERRADRADSAVVETLLPHSREVPVLVDELLQAARLLDASTLSRCLGQVFDGRGVCRGWVDVVVPFLVAVGNEWQAGLIGIEAEHLASECVSTELRHRVRHLWHEQAVNAPVLLASAADDEHALPLLALAAALAERKIGVRLLGARTPSLALVSAVRQVSPKVVFLWSSLAATGRAPDLSGVDGQSSPMMLLGGPGWGAGVDAPSSTVPTEIVDSLPDAVERIAGLVA
jgi:DNA-binding transcriptional MerR regulator